LSENKKPPEIPFPEASLQIASDQYYTAEIGGRQIKNGDEDQKKCGFLSLRLRYPGPSDPDSVEKRLFPLFMKTAYLKIIRFGTTLPSEYL